MGSFPGTYNDPTDYKLATKFIAKRLEKVLSHLIARDHTCYIKGRFIGENNRRRRRQRKRH